MKPKPWTAPNSIDRIIAIRLINKIPEEYLKD